jgi:hypothetical protein
VQIGRRVVDRVFGDAFGSNLGDLAGRCSADRGRRAGVEEEEEAVEPASQLVRNAKVEARLAVTWRT